VNVPYRLSARIEAPPSRWGATLLVRILTWPERRSRRAARKQAADLRARNRLTILRCWEQMRQDAGFLYPVQCTCTRHSKTTDARGRESWVYVDPNRP